MKVDKKSEQLGMNVSTASGRLVRDLLFDFVTKSGNDKCFRCGEKIERSDFSIEHKTSWLDSGNAVGLFFDVDNIAYSHKGCNYAAGATSKTGPAPCGTRAAYSKGCRCTLCKEAATALNRNYYTPAKRRAQYEKHGK